MISPIVAISFQTHSVFRIPRCSPLYLTPSRCFDSTKTMGRSSLAGVTSRATPGTVRFSPPNDQDRWVPDCDTGTSSSDNEVTLPKMSGRFSSPRAGGLELPPHPSTSSIERAREYRFPFNPIALTVNFFHLIVQY